MHPLKTFFIEQQAKLEILREKLSFEEGEPNRND